MKKFALIFLIFILTSQSAFAIIPLLVTGSRIVSAGLQTSLGQNVAIGSALGVGLIFAQLNWERNGIDGSSNKTTLYYTNAPRPPSAIESAAGFSAGSPSLAPPSTSSPFAANPNTVSTLTTASICNTVYTSQGTIFYNTLNGLSYVWSDAGTRPGLMADGWSIVAQCGTSTQFMLSKSISGCPAGYSQSGSNCTLSNQALVARPSDGFCPVTRSGATYAADITDPDCSGGVAPTFAADGSFSVTGADGVTISSAPTGVAGERKITYTEPNASTNTTRTREIVLADGSTASDSPYIKGVIDKYTQGTGAASTSTPVTAPVAPPTPADMTGVTAAVNANTAAVNQAATDTAAWRAGQPARIAADRAADRVVPEIEQIPKISIPFSITPTIFSSSASCPNPIAFNMLGKAYSIDYDPMCTLMDTLRPLFLALGAFGAAIIFIGGIKV